jgi:TonB-linked SusC/RagA family outer membrane protein
MTPQGGFISMSLNRGLRALLATAIAGTLALAGATAAEAQQTGTVGGTVMDATTLEPIRSAQVLIQGTQLGTLTDARGRFLIQNVPTGTHQLQVELIGYSARTQTVNVRAGEVTTVDVRMQSEALALEGIVVTGVAAATPRARLPFTVDQLIIDEAMTPVVSAGAVLQGKVAGAHVISGSGRPGSGHSILLRGPTSINASGRGQGPLIIVDGVILGASLVDIDALDIENVEVVKGAAAASFYGSRAAAGVINITTRTGARMVDDQVRFTLRTEAGQNQLERTLPVTQSHHFRMSGNPEKPFLTAGGVEFAWFDRSPTGTRPFYVPTLAGADIWTTFQDQPWPQTFDHVDMFFRGGTFHQHQLAATGRAGAMNFHAAATVVGEDGVIWNQRGYDRQTFRINVDQGVGQRMQLAARAFFSRSESGLWPEAQTGANPLFNLTRAPAGVDLRERDPDTGEYRIIMRPGEENANPLEELEKREYSDERDRFLGSANLRWAALPWLDLDINASYDRANQRYEDYYPVGFQTARATPALNQGNIWRAGERTDALNTSATASVHRRFGDNLGARLQGRYLYEAQDYDIFQTWGHTLAIRGLRTLQGTTAGHGRSSQVTSIRSEGYFGILNLDYAGRYIADALVRRDGSSLFGEDERWQTYFRLAGAWRIAEEPWWTVPAINELKLRYSVGTAGGRPNFFAQYETYNISATGLVTPQVLGNPNLKPEFVTEHEAGLELGFLDRFMFTGVYARTRAEDQILPVPLPAVSGWVTRWTNAGTLESNTIELSLDAHVLQRGNFNWTSRLLWDRTRQEITELHVPPFTYGANAQGLTEVFYARAGEPLGTIYGTVFATGCGDLPGVWAGRCDQFAVNNDGYLVWVGQGGNLSNPQWGTIHPETIGADAVWWGTPFAVYDEDGNSFLPIGNTQPDFRWSLANTFSLGGFRLYTLFDAEQGADVYNMPRHWMTFQLYAAEGDQAGLPANEKKPIGYYANLYRNLNPKNSHFVEDGSFIKLREASLSYRFTPAQLAAVPGLGNLGGLALSVTGRNLKTWTNYQGYDPEVGVAAGELGSAALNRFDGYMYPNFRTWTMALEVNF